MHPCGSAEIGSNWDEGIVPYNHLEIALSESVAGYPYLYSYGITKCKFLAELIGRPVLNIENYGFPTQLKLRLGYSCVLPCHIFNYINCAARNQISSTSG